MDADTRNKLAMGGRIRSFNRAHPSDSPRFIEAAARLEDLLAKAEKLATQQRDGRLTVRGSVIRRAGLKEEIRQKYLKPLAGIAQAAFATDPAVRQRFRVPSKTSNRQDFVTGVRGIMAEATARRDAFIAFGMVADFLDKLAAALQEYDEGVNDANAGLSAKVGARADLDTVAAEIMEIAQVLDAINRLRFNNNPELLAAWESARNLPWPSGDGAEPSPPEQSEKPAA
jgi:predicted transcriptional regulator